MGKAGPYGDLVAQERGGSPRYHHFDALGSTRALSDALQVATDEYVFGAWGEPKAASGASPNPYRWVGELGYRYDKYNNIDDPVWTPKVAANWLIGDGFTLRGTWGHSFRVPSFAGFGTPSSRFPVRNSTRASPVGTASPERQTSSRAPLFPSIRHPGGSPLPSLALNGPVEGGCWACASPGEPARAASTATAVTPIRRARINGSLLKTPCADVPSVPGASRVT